MKTKTTTPKNGIAKIVRQFIAMSNVLAALTLSLNHNLIANSSFNKPDSLTNFLEIKATIREAKGLETTANRVENATVEIYDASNNCIREHTTNKHGKCDIVLPLNSFFVIRISKNGLVPKTVEINTNIPSHRMNKYVFKFEMDMFEFINEIAVSDDKLSSSKEKVNYQKYILKHSVSYLLEQPIAKIEYNGFMKFFDYDYNYTYKINSELKHIYELYYTLREKENMSRSIAAGRQE